MSVIEIYPDEPCLIPVKFSSDPLTPYNKAYSDIQEIYMGLKKDVSDDDDEYLQKYWKDGAGGGAETGDVLLSESSHTFTMNKEETDVVELGDYNMYVGVLVSGLTKMIWLRVDKEDIVRVVDKGITQ